MAGIMKYNVLFLLINLQFEKEITKPKSIKSYFLKLAPLKSDTFLFPQWDFKAVCNYFQK